MYEIQGSAREPGQNGPDSRAGTSFPQNLKAISWEYYSYITGMTESEAGFGTL